MHKVHHIVRDIGIVIGDDAFLFGNSGKQESLSYWWNKFSGDNLNLCNQTRCMISGTYCPHRGDG
jgi:hypothetical protein